MTRGDVKTRLDVPFNQPENEARQISIFSTKPLGDLVTFVSGGTPSKANNSFWSGEIPWVSPKDFGEHYLQDSEDHISQAGQKDAVLQLIPANSILMVVRSGILRHSLPVALTQCAVTINQDLKALLPTAEIFPEFLADYFAVFGTRILPLISKHSTTVQSLNTPQLADWQIPLPPLPIQQKLTAKLQTARLQRKANLDQADALLSGLDAWLLERLGLTPPAPDKRSSFAVTLGQARQRFDVDFHSPEFRNLRLSIENSKWPVVSVRDVTTRIETGFAAGRDAQAEAESGVPHIRPMNITPQGEFSLKKSKFVPRDAVAPGNWLQAGEVLFNNTNSTAWVGKTAVFEGEAECACSNHITRIEFDQARVQVHFVAALFNALRSTGMFGLLSTNFNNQAGINAQTLGAFQFPLPPLPLQQTIAAEVARRRDQARRLREEAESAWESAKTRFEAQLLGGETL